MSMAPNGAGWWRGALLLLLFAVVFAAVWLWRFGAVTLGGDQSATGRAAPIANQITPGALFTKLGPATTLAEAADGFAGALGIPADSVRVRLRFSGCAACDVEERAQEPDLTLAAAAAEIQRAEAFWLVHNDLICLHVRQNDLWTPQSCAVFLSPGKE